MKLASISKEDFGYHADLGFLVIGKYEIGRRDIAKHDECLRLMWSYSPLEIKANGISIPNEVLGPRSAIKVHPETEISINAEKSSVIYVATLLKNEEKFLENLMQKHQHFFNNLTGRDKDEWDGVKNQNLDYVLDDERNSENIYVGNGVLIAPNNSKFKPNAPNGWHTMYARGSRALGVAIDDITEVRSDEKAHYHKIITEFYVGSDGAIEIENDGKNMIIEKDIILVAEPKEMHKISKMMTQSYKGTTIQFPSIPGDKYEKIIIS